MTTTATIISVEPQTGDRSRVTIEYLSDTGFVSRKDPLLDDSAAPYQIYADSQIPAVEASWVDQDRQQGWEVGSKGGDPDTIAYRFDTLANVKKYYFRRLFDEMRDDVGAGAERADICATCRPYMNKYNASATSAIVDDPNWGVSQTGDARSNISAVGVNYDQVDSGGTYLPLDDF